VQRVGIIVADILPVDRAGAQRHPALRHQFGQAIGLKLGAVGRHHLRHRRAARALTHER